MSNRDIALSYLKSFSSGEPEAIAAHVSEDFQNNHISELGTGSSGRDTYRERLIDFLAAFKHLQYTAEEVIADENKVAVAYKMSFEENDRPIEIRGVMLMTMDDGLITVRTDCWDGLTYLRQAGIDYKDL